MPSMDSRVGILKILKQWLQGMDFKTIVSINFITMGSLGFRAIVSKDRVQNYGSRGSYTMVSMNGF